MLVAVACLAVRARGVRDNNREAAFIGLAVGLSLPIWISSAIGSVAASTESDREAWLAYGLLATSLLVFLTMFLPKGRQLAALGREATATVIRDRDDAMSSLPGSGYSPSFFHFKPAEASLKRKMHYHSGGTFVQPNYTCANFQQLKHCWAVCYLLRSILFFFFFLRKRNLISRAFFLVSFYENYTFQRRGNWNRRRVFACFFFYCSFFVPFRSFHTIMSTRRLSCPIRVNSWRGYNTKEERKLKL